MTLLKDETEAWMGDGGSSACEEPTGSVGWTQRDDRPVMLVVGGSDRAGAIERWGERAGLRCLDRVGLSEAADRLARTVRLDLILLDLRGAEMEAGLDRETALALAARPGLAQTRLAVIVDMAGLDCALAMLDAPNTEFLCDPADSEVVSLLVMAGMRECETSPAVSGGMTPEAEAVRLEQLSEEVRRLATTIERMTSETGNPLGLAGAVMEQHQAYHMPAGVEGEGRPALFQLRERRASSSAPSDATMPTHAEIRALIRARRIRDQFLPADLFADPAWDMILDLMAAHLAGQRVSVSSLCIAAAVPPTTALRWIRQLTDRDILARVNDPQDGRRVFVELTGAAAEAMRGWSQAVRRKGGLLAGARR